MTSTVATPITTTTAPAPSSSTTAIAGAKVFREVERPSASLCDIVTDDSVIVRVDPTTKRWIETKIKSKKSAGGGDDDDGKDGGSMTEVEGDAVVTEEEEEETGEEVAGTTPVVKMEGGTTVRVSPMEWKCNGWAEEHFHEKLKLPDKAGTKVGRGLVITVEAMARECVAIALSPTPYFELGKTYAVHFGASCNLQTVIRRRIPSANDDHQITDDDEDAPASNPSADEAVDTTVPTPQICTPHKFSSYWIALHDRGKLSVGLGNVPGMDCVATLDDTLYHALRSGQDAVRYVGIGNSALGRNARSLKVRNLRLMPLPEVFGDANGGGDTSIALREWSVLGNREMKFDDEGNDYMDGVDTRPKRREDDTGTTGRDASMWIEYQTQCHKAKARAQKFGTEYRQPPPDAFFKWSEARRLRANPERGFVTGIDILSVEEREKARKRKERFDEDDIRFGGGGEMGEDGSAAGGSADAETNANDGVDGASTVVGSVAYSEWDASTIATYGTTYDRQNQILPLKQAWDHFDLVRKHRVDPPPHLFPSTSTTTPATTEKGDDDTTKAVADSTSMEVTTSTGNDDGGDGDGDGDEPVPVLEKIHLFAIDWAAFKQIRTDDIMAYFADYGPSYVEWLGELSCNVLFEDKYTSARAIEAMSRPIPHPKEVLEPEDVIDSTAVTDRTAMADEDSSDEKDATTTTEQQQEQQEQEQPQKPPAQQEQIMKEDDELLEEELAVDLGSMGWRFCNRPIRKIQSNRFGRKGTRSRCLMRVASSVDVLEDRPTAWPKPPPGFTTMRVLGPGSDEVGSRGRRGRRNGGGGGSVGSGGNKRQKRNRGRSRGSGGGRSEGGNGEGMDVDDESFGDDDDTIDRGLKSSRAGFTVEEMEEERRSKANAST